MALVVDEIKKLREDALILFVGINRINMQLHQLEKRHIANPVICKIINSALTDNGLLSVLYTATLSAHVNFDDDIIDERAAHAVAFVKDHKKQRMGALSAKLLKNFKKLVEASESEVIKEENMRMGITDASTDRLPDPPEPDSTKSPDNPT